MPNTPNTPLNIKLTRKQASEIIQLLDESAEEAENWESGDRSSARLYRRLYRLANTIATQIQTPSSP